MASTGTAPSVACAKQLRNVHFVQRNDQQAPLSSGRKPGTHTKDRAEVLDPLPSSSPQTPLDLRTNINWILNQTGKKEGTKWHTYLRSDEVRNLSW